VTGAAAGWAGKAGGWLRAGRGGMFLLAVLIGAGAGLGAVAFRYLIDLFTWLATGHGQAVLYATEDLCDRAGRGRPEWARPAVGGVVLVLPLLPVSQASPGTGCPGYARRFDDWAASYDLSPLQAVLCGPVHDAVLQYVRQHVPHPG